MSIFFCKTGGRHICLRPLYYVISRIVIIISHMRYHLFQKYSSFVYRIYYKRGAANPEDPISLSVYIKRFGLIRTLLTSLRPKIILKKEIYMTVKPAVPTVADYRSGVIPPERSGIWLTESRSVAQKCII